MNDSTLVDKIIEDIVKKLDWGTSSANLKGLVGIERRMQEVMSLLQYGFPDFRMLGIWGMGGIGKTTLADAIYHHVSNGFQSCCFIANVREHEERRELLKLRKEFLSTILEDENLYISTPTNGSGFIKDRLSKKKVLIVCDDVSKLSQLEFLFGGIDRFGPESRVIVTTRNKQVLIQCGIDLIYEVKELDEDESVQLFCQRAFKSNNPIEYQLELSRMVLSVANGNPLAIRLIGSSLCGMTKSYQESEVKKLKQVPKQDIQNVLKWSFDGLDCEEKEMFLDIVFFFKGKDRDYVTRIMDACYVSAHSGIENLINKSLISVSRDQIEVHDLLQQMGWNIVHDESPLKPEKRSRLWIPEDSYDVLSKNNGTEMLRGIELDMSQLAKLELEPTAMMKMRKLRFLKFYRSCGRILLFKGLLSFPEELRYLYWEGYPLRSLPTKFDLKYLVELDMRESHLEQLWEGQQDLVNLKVITLDYSRNLVRIPDLSSATNLEEINLSDCSNLRELPSSLQHLEKLTLLNFRNCENLRSLPSFYKATSLTNLDLRGCSNLCSFPKIMGTMESLRRLDISGTALKELPSSIENLISLDCLRMKNCKNLVCLPDSFYKLKSLKTFYLNSCSRLEIFPEVMDTMEELCKLDLSGTALKELPSSIDNLIGLEYLSLHDCENLVCLPDSFYKLKSLKTFELKGCSRLEIFPKVMDTMGELYELDLSGTALKELPSSIDNLIGLVYLSLNDCENLVGLPDSFYKLKSLSTFNLKGCSRLEIFPEVMDTMEELYELDLSRTTLKELPSSIDNLIGLEYLSLNYCENLVCFPDSFYKLKSLLCLSLCGCSTLVVKNLFTTVGGGPVNQKDLHGLSSLKKLDLSESNLENLSTTIRQYPLHELILRNCKGLKSLPELPPSLECLDAHDCTSLEDVSSIKKLFEQALFFQDKPYRRLHLKFSNCFKLGEKGMRNDIDADDSTSLEGVSSIKKVLKQAVFCKSLGWLFTNCFQLDQKAVSSAETPKLEMPFEHMVTLLKDYHQEPPESKNRACIITCVPGSEIPECFDFKSLGSSMNIQLPSEWCSNNSWINIPSFVASAVVSLPDSYTGGGLGIRCECHLKSCNENNYWFGSSSYFSFGSRLSDHVFLLYGGFNVREIVRSEASNNRIYNMASFNFYIEGWGSSQCEVK